MPPCIDGYWSPDLEAVMEYVPSVSTYGLYMHMGVYVCVHARVRIHIRVRARVQR